MCGIIGYIGNKEVLPILINGLKALEYRGYDSGGIAIYFDGEITLKKKAGRVEILEETLRGKSKLIGHLGIGHTRWATHGEPSEVNSHPHTDCVKRIFVVHNGIIENYGELKKYLQNRDHRFQSATDTEVIPHLIEDFLKEGSDFKTALFNALKMIKGAYALAVIDSKNPDTLYAVRMSSPLVIGIGYNENFLASDTAALVEKTKEVIYLKDGEIAEITKENVNVINFKEEQVSPEIVKLEFDLEQAQKENYSHFMLKEIFEGPEVVFLTLRARLKNQENLIKLGGLEQVAKKLKKVKRILILACGTSYYAGLIGEFLFEEISKIPVEVHLASEFRYREQPFDEGTIAIAISQSGETADTLAAIRKAKDNNLLTIGIVNSVGSSIARETEAGVYNHVGPEIGVASTKAFISQLIVLILMSLYFSKTNGHSSNEKILKNINEIPEKIKIILDKSHELEKLADKYKNYNNFLFLGRRYNYPVALEGALKLKEVSYIHAEGYGAGEMKHGPLAMISNDFPIVAIVPQNKVIDKMFSNLEEIKARNGLILAIATEGNEKILSLANDVFFIPKTIEPLEPLLTIIPLQLLAYYIGNKKGFDVDKPRNLAKSVTVE